jgi:hypothetical protein
MKKTYTTPTLIENGDVVRETLGGDAPGNELINPTVFRPEMPGSIGYYL